MSEQPLRKLAAIVSADVVGYSRLMGLDETGTLADLRRHREDIIDPLIAKFGGRIVKTMGDGLLLEFPSVVNATECAVAVQQAMAEHNAKVDEERRIVFRVGVNLGDIIVEGEDILGDGVNIAARLQTIAAPGGVSISRRVYEDVQDRLDIAFENGGELTLKNIARPVQVWHWSPDKAAVPVGGKPASDSVSEEPSVAVMPFDNMSGDPEQEYFADGITEDIITELSRYGDIHVTARNSTFAYKGRALDLTQVAAELGVRFVVEGSIRKAGRRVRITAQLIDGATGNHLWAERYDRELEDIFELQDEITRTITATVGGRVIQDDISRALRKDPNDVDAYDLTLQADYRFSRLSKSDNLEARRLATQAIELAPDFARAYAILSTTHTFEIIQLWGTDAEKSLKLGLDFAIKGISLDDRDARAHGILGLAEVYSGFHDRAIESTKKSIKINPNNATSHSLIGIVHAYAGQLEAGLEAIDLAMRLNPLHPAHYGIIRGRLQYLLGTYDEAERSLRDVLKSTPEFPAARAHLAATLAAAGKLDEARIEAETLIKINPNYRLGNIPMSHPYKDRDVLDKFIDDLRRAGLPE